MKTEPNADMRALANICWQMYTALTDQGFNEYQALTIIGQTLTASMFKGKDDD